MRMQRHSPLIAKESLVAQLTSKTPWRLFTLFDPYPNSRANPACFTSLTTLRRQFEIPCLMINLEQRITSGLVLLDLPVEPVTRLWQALNF